MGKAERQDANQTHGGPLVDRVYEELESGILYRRIKPGEPLLEMKLSAELGVSRTPVREAIRMLEQKGLVVASPHKGAVVVGVNRKDLDDIYAIRMHIEALATRWAAKTITDSQLEALTEIVDLQEFYHMKNSASKINELDSRFHERIYQYSNSRTLMHILTELHHMILWFRELSFGSAGRAEKAIEEHRRIIEALSAHDEDMAESLTAEHIKNARENLMRIIEAD